MTKYKEVFCFKNLNKYKLINGVTYRNFGSIDISNPKSTSKLANFISKSFGKKINSQNIIFVQQVHESKIHICSDEAPQAYTHSIFRSFGRAKSAEANFAKAGKDKSKIIPEVDALVTCKPGLVLVIRTADCIPVLLFDPQKKVVAAIHAGRRGLLENIIPKTVNILKNKFNCTTKNILVGIGPYIKKCCYEVGSDVENEVKKVYPDSWKNFLQKRNNKLYLDLEKIIYKQILGFGIKKENIEDINLCTSCRNNLFFSYRKSKTKEEKNKRLATFVGL